MRKITRVLVIILLLNASACNLAENKIPLIADEFCNCFRQQEKDISQNTINIIFNAAADSDPRNALERELSKLSPDQQQLVTNEIIAISQAEEPASRLGQCIRNVEKKYGKSYTANQEKFQQKIITELESKQECALTAAIMKLGLKMKDE